MNIDVVVDKGMLAWQREATLMHTRCLENFTICMKLMQGIVEGVEGRTVKFRTPGKITEVEESGDAFDNVWMHKIMNGRQVHLKFQH